MAEVLTAPPMKSQSGAVRPLTRAELDARIAPYAQADSFQGYKSFAVDIALYALGLAGVLFIGALGGKIAGGLVAGLALVSLGSLSHEAAHRSLVKSRVGNKAIAVVSFTMILFNYRLWIYDHHVMHHGRTNVKHNNFLSPLAPAEYRDLSSFRRALYRAYHSQSGAGILLYFLLERWPTVHFYPGAWLPRRFHASAWGYAALLAAYASSLLGLLVLVPAARGESILAAILCGFVLPYTIWFTTFSMTVFFQHTHPRLRWHPTIAGIAGAPEALSVHVGVPRWLNYMSHYAMEHPVHHVSALIPHYRLKQAQAALADVAAPEIVTMRFTLANMRDVLRRCRLYDYDEHSWLDFNGEVTAVPTHAGENRAHPAERLADDLLPDHKDPESPGIFFPTNPGASATKPAASVRREDA